MFAHSMKPHWCNYEVAGCGEPKGETLEAPIKYYKRNKMFSIGLNYMQKKFCIPCPERVSELVEWNGHVEDDLVLIYNRVPKTGSTSFAGIAYDLCKHNHFNVLHVNTTKNAHVMSLSDQCYFYEAHNRLCNCKASLDGRVVYSIGFTVAIPSYYIFLAPHWKSVNFLTGVILMLTDTCIIFPFQMRFVQNITEWHEKKPALYHGHLAYIEFSRFGIAKKPVYINLIRNPLDRLISYYYFVRYGDDFRPFLRRRKAGNTETFDECVEKQGHDCDPEHLWLQIPFFCGQDAECWKPGSQWALERAKYNLLHNYLIVEELGDFIAVLEAALPRLFKGAVKLYNQGKKSHLRKTSNKIPPKEETLAKIQESHIWKMEQDFYDFVAEQFHFIKQHTFELYNGAYIEKGNRFHYEKIRP
ncbi:LOW QUALITY PROTEIN: hypothetical protein KUTeg_011195, partial [Tegillarca granosa]